MSHPQATTVGSPSPKYPAYSVCDERTLAGHSSPRGYPQPLVGVLAAMALGIIADDQFGNRVLGWRWKTIWLLAAGCLIAWRVALVRRRFRTAGVLLLLAVAVTAAAWHHARWRLFSRDELAWAVGGQPLPVALEAVVRGSPQFFPEPPRDVLRSTPLPPRTRIPLEILRVRNGQQWRRATGNSVLAVQGDRSDLRPGDHVRVMAQLLALDPVLNPGGTDWQALSRADRVLCHLRAEAPDCISRLPHPTGRYLARAFDALRRLGDQLLWNKLAQPRFGLASALLLGQGEALEEARVEPFVLTGTVHILAVSGMHVGLLIGVLLLAVRSGLLPRRAGLILTVAATAGYALLTGAEPPVVRAAAMLALACAGLYARRRLSGINTLAAAAVLVLVLQPRDLFHAGAQLSFLCVATLIALAPRLRVSRPRDPLDRLLADTRPWAHRALASAGRWVTELTLLSAALWVVTTPLVMARFHVLATCSLILNVLLWPIVSLAMLSGFGLLMVGSWVPPLGYICAGLCNASLAVLENVVTWTAQQPWSHAYVPGPSNVWLAVFYGLLGGWLLMPRWRPAPRWQVALLCGWIALGLVRPVVGPSLRALGGPQEPALRCTFLAVGHGLSVLVELPDGRALLYDAGQLGSPDRAVNAVSQCLWELGRRRIDALFLSHADIDHYNAVPELTARFSVGQVFVGPQMFDESPPPLLAVRAALEQQRVPISVLVAGQRLRTHDGVELLVRHPAPLGGEGNDNAQSLVLEIAFQQRRILLTGDLESPGLERLLVQDSPGVDVLLAPHHGSARSDPPGIAAWCRPRWVVASGGRSDTSALVRAAYQRHGATMLHTATDGAVIVEIDATGLRVVPWVRPPAE